MMRTSEARRLYSPMLSSQRGRTAPLVFLASRRLRGFLRSQHGSELTHFDRLVQCCHRPEAFVLRQHLGVSRVVRCITYAPLSKCPWAARRKVVDMARNDSWLFICWWPEQRCTGRQSSEGRQAMTDREQQTGTGATV